MFKETFLGSAPSSLPAREVWIEMFIGGMWKNGFVASLPAREVWIEMTSNGSVTGSCQSLPAREVWIEIINESVKKVSKIVTSRKGSVD